MANGALNKEIIAFSAKSVGANVAGLQFIQHTMKRAEEQKKIDTIIRRLFK